MVTPSHPNGDRPDAISAAEHTRRRLLDQTRDEIDALAAEYHGRLSRDRARSIGAFYARFSTRFQQSIGDQVRALFETAVANQIFVPRECICVDVAVRGNKNRRPGLDRLRAIVGTKNRQIDVLLVLATNRLFRKTYRALQFVEEEIVDRGVRCIFVSSGIDTADKDRWRMLLQIHAMTDEAVGGMYANHVRAAHLGLFARGLITGSLPLGYRGRVVQGELTKRQRPRRAVEVDPETAPYVVQAFRWYAVDRFSISEIARRFNADPRIPCGEQFRTGYWTAKTIRSLLANPRYTGRWAYGASQNVWQNRKDYGRQVRRAEPLGSAQRENLRIVNDDLWDRAQQRLERNDRSAVGRKPKDGDRKSRPLLLNGIFHCATHRQMLYVGGPHGHLSFCRTCRALPVKDRPLYSLLNREQAVAKTCEVLAELIQADPDLTSRVISACRDQVAAAKRPDPGRLASLKSRRDGLTRQIDFITQDPGDTDLDREESRAKLRQLRQERSRIVAELAVLELAANRPAIAPDESQIRELINKLGEILTTAASTPDNSHATRAREAIEMLTGGRIELHQMGERKAHRGWLQGRFRIRLIEGLVGKLTGIAVESGKDADRILIDYNVPSPSEAIADQVKALYDQGQLIKAIAIELGITRNMVAKSLNHWHNRRGLPKPDGRTRRSALKRKHLETPKFVKISEDVMMNFDTGMSYDQIAQNLGCDRNMVAKAVRFWHEMRKLPIPDGRNRRKALKSLRGRADGRTATPPSVA
jgi:DNA invertase Pin-like site-specific DNA recombinase